MNQFIKKNTIMTISGANASGKTNLIKYIIQSFQKNDPFNCIIILSNTAGFNGDFDFLKQYNNTFIISLVYFQEVISSLLKKQRQSVQKGLKSHVLVVFDDIGSFKDDKLLKTLISQNRHFFITVCFSVQYINMSCTYLREISTYDIIFELKTQNSLKAAYENYFISDFNNFVDFKIKINHALAKYHFIFCDKLNNTKQIMIAPLI